MLDNNKLAKELASIYSASNKAKKSVIAELAKIDEKYRKLAEQEKEKLNKTLEMLEAQLKFYKPLLDLNKPEEPSGELYQEDKPADVAPEEKIEDTIFPENNETDKVEDDAETAVPEESTDADTVDDGDAPAGDEFGDIWPANDDAPAEEKVEEEKKEEASEEEWPAFPEEWK